jgi:hypothetical protein
VRAELAKTRAADDRRYIVQKALTQGWVSLTPNDVVDERGQARFDPSWTADVAETVLGSSVATQSLAPSELVRIARTALAGAAPSMAVIRVLDRRMSQPQDVACMTAALVDHDLWSAWRERTELDPARLRECALAWLGLGVWRSDPSVTPTVAHWSNAIGDVDRLGRDELKRLVDPDGRVRWPWLPDYLDLQLHNLAKLIVEGRDLARVARAVALERDQRLPTQEHALRILYEAWPRRGELAWDDVLRVAPSGPPPAELRRGDDEIEEPAPRRLRRGARWVGIAAWLMLAALIAVTTGTLTWLVVMR